MHIVTAALTGVLLGFFQPVPGAAVAQMPPGGPPVVRGATPSDGITVSAAGYVQAPADKATVTVRLYSQKPTITLASLAPIIDALVKAGVDRANISTPLALAPQGTPSTNATIVAIVDHPTAAMIRDAIPTMVSLFSADPALNANAEVQLAAANCEKLVDAARAQAIRLAHQRAQDAARSLGVSVGTVRAFSSYDLPIDARGDCRTSYNLPGYNGQAFQSLDDYVTVRVSSNVTVRYAIR